MQSRARVRDYSLEIKELILNTKKYSEIHTSMEKREKKNLVKKKKKKKIKKKTKFGRR